MKAAVMRDRTLVVDTIPDPAPASGEVLVKTLACGICGSDLHALRYADEMSEVARESGAPFVMDASRDVVMGHEFCAEIVDFGPNTMKMHPPGTRVVSIPIVARGAGIQPVGYSNEVPGGYAEAMVLTEPLLLPVPNGMPAEHAALTEPMAVGLHAVEKSGIGERDAALVVGCGPVGLAVIAALRLKGVETVVASDYSPMRRRLAEGLGAHVVVDPAVRTPSEAFQEAAGLRPAVLFECVGVPGVIQSLLKDAPREARIVVVGVCMETDHIRPMYAINKELRLQFVLGYTPDEFARTLRAIAEGEIEVGPLITGRVGLEGVPAAFEDLSRPEAHAKILVEPGR